MDTPATAGQTPAPLCAFPAALRGAIARRGLTLAEISARAAAHGVRVSPATLSMWQSGRRLPQSRSSMGVVGVLEEILQTEPNELWDLLTVPTRIRHSVGRTDYEAQRDFPPAVAKALGELDMLGPRELDEVSAQASVEIGADRQRASISKLQVVRATRQGAQRILHGWVGEPGAEAVQILALRGCTVGRQAVYPDDGIHLMELVLPTPLVRNATAVIETSETFPAHQVGDSDQFEYIVAGRVTQVVLVIRFADDARPQAGETYLVDEDGTEYEHTPQSVIGGLHHVVHDFGPGRIGIRWWWPARAG